MNAALDAQLRVSRGQFTLDMSLSVAPGEVLAVLGPNGSGKSTLLATLAGLIRPDAGTVTVAGDTLTRRSGDPRRHRAGVSIKYPKDVAVPPSHRHIGLLRQEPLLFPHLSAVENIAFGQRSSGIRKAVALEDAQRWLLAVGLEEYGHNKPAQLSGGQQQRIAIARALAVRPRVLLLDEPMAALDVQTAVRTRRLLHEQLAANGTTAVLVTHDVLDAIVLADRVAVLQDGYVVDVGEKSRVLRRPRNQFIAALAGLNLVHGSVDATGRLTSSTGHSFAGLTEGGVPYAAGTAASAVFSPSDVHVDTAEPAVDSNVNRWASRIAALEPATNGIRVRIADDDNLVAHLAPVRVAELELAEGQPIWLSIAASRVELHSAD